MNNFHIWQTSTSWSIHLSVKSRKVWIAFDFVKRSLPQNRHDHGRNFNNLKRGPSSFWIFTICLALISFTLIWCADDRCFITWKNLDLQFCNIWSQYLIHTSIKPANPLFAKLRSICCSASKCTCYIRNLSN